ncbi:MAG TPA: nuclease A inhibitor family protein [Pyrinomonadaceae bacterium]|nr:nuclease A inhibitor family protein [Pyrinomonadaceae bacterium]
MKSDEEIIEELKRTTVGLLFMSESDYPFDIFYMEGQTEMSAEYIRELSGEPADSPVEVKTVDEFFRVAISEPDWKGKAELAVAERYQSLLKLLKENLDGLKVYRVGQVNIAVYIVGRAQTGNWLGLSTRVVET